MTLGVASASSLGGLPSKTLAAWNKPGLPTTPTVLTCDNFALPGASGSLLDGRPVQLPSNCGSGYWTVHAGTWKIKSGELDPKGGDSTATISAGQTNVSAEATVLHADGRNRVAGIVINHNETAGSYLVGALSGPDVSELLLVNGGSVTTIATASATIGASSVVRISRNGTAVAVSVDGLVRISYTLTAGQVATLSGGTSVGLYFDSGNAIRFTDVMATTPASP